MSRWTAAKAAARGARSASSGGSAADLELLAGRAEPHAPAAIARTGSGAAPRRRRDDVAGGSQRERERRSRALDDAPRRSRHHAAPRAAARGRRAPDYERMGTGQLQLLCRERGLPDRGSAAQLLEGLYAHDRGLRVPPAHGRSPTASPARRGPAAGRVRLAADFAEAGAEDTEERRRFERRFIRDLARTLSISASRIRIVGLAEGSIIVKFEIAPPEAGGGGGGGAPEPTAEEALQTLQSEVEAVASGERSSTFDLAGAPVTACKVVVQPSRRPQAQREASRSAVVRFEILPGREGEVRAQELEQKLRRELVDGSFKSIASKEIKGFAGVPLDHPLLAAPHPPHEAAARARAAHEAASKRRMEGDRKGLMERRRKNGGERGLLAINDLMALIWPSAPFIRELLSARAQGAARAWGTYACYPEALVSLNPGLDHVDDAVVTSYSSEFGSGSLQPHVFGIAGAAYRQLLYDRRDRAIICTGESGSGKTRAARNVLKFLAERSGGPARYEKRLLCAAEVLDAFGNARLPTSPDASRFGKYMKLWINHSTGDATRAWIRTTQIERRRVYLSASEERSFHIFYQMCAGVGRDERQELLHNSEARDFAYLGNYVEAQGDQRKDAEAYRRSRDSMDGANISRDEQGKILRICAAVLALGNIEFTQGTGSVGFESEHQVEKASSLLGIDRDSLFEAFANRSTRDGSKVPNSADEARETRDALAGLIYQQLFSWICERLNRAMRGPEQDAESCNCLSVLDLCGFEKSVSPGSSNGFDQLCHNYADEKVHQLSVSHLANAEKELYALEKVEFPVKTFAGKEWGEFEGLDCVESFEAPGGNIIDALDDICSRSHRDGTADQNFRDALSDTDRHRFMERHKRSFTSTEDGDFSVKHFDSRSRSPYTVGYSTEGFSMRNRNSQDKDLASVCASSQHNPFLRTLFEEMHRSYMGRGEPRSALSQYRAQLKSIFDELIGVRLHYIKCLRPNHDMLSPAANFDDNYVQEQVLNLQLVPIIELRQDLFSRRFSFEELAARYGSMVPAGVLTTGSSGAFKVCKPILAAVEENAERQYQIGTTMLFMTEPFFQQLEQKLGQALTKAVVKLQSFGRMWIQLRRYREKQRKHQEDRMSEFLSSDNLNEIQLQVRKLDAMPEMQHSRRELMDRLDTLLDEMVKEISLLSGKAERMAEYLEGKKRVGPPERKAESEGVDDDAAPPPPKSFLSQINEKFGKMDSNLDDLLMDSEDESDDPPAAGSSAAFQSESRPLGRAAGAVPSGLPTPWAPKHVLPVPLPPALTECSIEEICSLSGQMKECIARYDANKAFAAEQFERINNAHGELIRQVKSYIRNYRDCADPEGFLRRIDDFTPLESELVELAALRSELEELVTRDRAHMRSMVRNSDPVEVYDVLQRSKGIDGVQSEWDLLNAHFQGLRRVALDELQGLLRETMPSQRSSDLRKYDVFGEDAKGLCVRVKAHRADLIRAAQQRLQDVMVSGGGPSAVREVLDLYKDYPEELDPARESVIAYLDNRVTSLAKSCDQLLLSESIEAIDEFLVRTPEQDFGEALRHKLEALHSRKRELIQALQLEIKSASRSTDIAKVSRALDASEPYLAYVGTERKELYACFQKLVKDTKAQMLSLMQGEDYAALLTMLEASEGFPPELASDVAALKLHRGTLLQQTKQHLRDVLATEDPSEIMQELNSITAYGDDIIDETLRLQQRRDHLVQQAKQVILTLLQNKEATIRGVLTALEQYATYPAELDSERDSLNKKLDVLVDGAERYLSDLAHSSDALAIDRALKEHDDTDERLKSALRTLLRHRKELSRNVSLKMHSMLHSEDPAAIGEVLSEAAPFGDDLESERTSLQAHRAAVLDRANREMEDLHRSSDYGKVADALKQYESFPEETKTCYKELDQHRQVLVDSARTAIGDMRANHPNDLQMASDAMMKYEAFPQHIRAMVAQWFQKLIGTAQIDILALVQSDQFATVDRALERYKRLGADELRQDLANLTRHRDNLLERIRKKLQMLSMSCEDPAEIDNELELNEEFGQHVAEEVKSLNDRRAKLIQMAQDELTKLVQSPDSTLRELEAAIKRYAEYPMEIHLIYNQGLKRKYEALIRQQEDRLAGLLTSFNIKDIDQALSELRNSCDILQPMLEKLDKHRQEACMATSIKMQAAARGTDAVVVAQILDDAKDFGPELQVERDALQDRYEWLIGDAKAEITEMLKSNNLSAIMSCIEKYEQFPSAIDQLRDKLDRHKEMLLSETRLRFTELCLSEDPQEIALHLNLTEPFAEYVHGERKSVQTRLDDLLRQARAEMRRILQDPDATLGEVETYLTRFADYPDDVQEARALLTSKRDAMADTASELLATLQHSNDIVAINEGLSKYSGSSDLVRSSVALVEKHRDDLCRAKAKQMRAAAASEDLVAMDDLLTSSEPYVSDEVAREQKALTLRNQTVTELVISEIRELCTSKDFERVDLACEKFKTYPEVIRPRWQELMGHRKELLEQARRELDRARKGSDPKVISETIAAVEKFGKAVAAERVALQARWSELIHNAHKDMLSLVQNKQATVDLIELKLAQYADFPRDVDEVRRKLRDKAESLQQVKQELAALCETEDPDEILQALKDFIRYGSAVSAEMEALQSRFRHLMRTARTNMRSAVQNPESTIREMDKMLSDYSGYPDDVAAVRNALQKKLVNSKITARERLNRLMSSTNIADIDEALAEFSDANQFLDNAVDELERHRDELCLAFSSKMEEALLSTDLQMVNDLLVESEPLGGDVQQLREAVTRHYNRLLEKTCAKLQALCQSDDYALIGETLDQHADDVHDIKADWEALQRHRDSLLDKNKASLKLLRTSEDPNEIDAALESTEGGGDEMSEETAALRNRRQVLVDDARMVMQRLLDSDTATITDVGMHLHRYRFYPEEVHEIRDELTQKHEILLEVAKKDLAELARSSDIERIDACIREVQDEHPSVVAGLRDLERHRNELVRSMSVKVQTAVGYDDPNMIIAVLEESQPFEDDLHSERGALKAHYDSIIITANDELHAALEHEDYDAVAALLAKYENYPGEVKQRWQTLHAHLSSLRQDTLFHVQQALTSRDSKEIDALLARIGTFGSDMDKYRDMLLLRRTKLLETARQSIRQALTSTDLKVIDRTFEENSHLVNEFPKEYFSSLRKHREDVVAGVRQGIRQAIDGFSLVEVDRQLETTSGFEDELFEDIQELQEHRSYVLEEADAVKQSGRSVLTSMDFATVDAKLTQLEAFGTHCQDEVSALRAHRKWLIDMARADMRNCASSTEPQLIAATLVKYEHMGEAVQEEAAALAACVSQLQEQHRTWLVDALRESNPQSIKRILDSTEYFGEELASERARLVKHRNETIENGRAEMGRQLAGNSLTGIEAALRDFDGFGDEVQELYDVLQAHYHQLCEVATHRMRDVAESGDLELMALTLDEYRSVAPERLGESVHSLELSYTREATAKRQELRELLACDDIAFLRARLLATPACDAYLEELSALETRITVLVENGRAEMNELMASDDRVAIQAALRRYEGEELDLSEEIAILRGRLAALQQGRRFHVPSRSQREATASRDVLGRSAPATASSRGEGRSRSQRPNATTSKSLRPAQQPQPEPEPEPEPAHKPSAPLSVSPAAAALALPPHRPAPQPRTRSTRSRTASREGAQARAPTRQTEADIEHAIVALCQTAFDESDKQRYRAEFKSAALRQFSPFYDHLAGAGADGQAATCVVCSNEVQPHECEGHIRSCRDALIKFSYKKRRKVRAPG